MPHIPKTQLLHGQYYSGHCRNAVVARWNAADEKFYHWRTKFGQTFIETIRCPEDDTIYDVFRAEKLIPTPIDNEITF